MASDPKLVWKTSAPELLEMSSPSTPRLRRSPAFPQEICELVINACASFRHGRAWSARARRWLFYHIKITSSVQFSKIFHVIAENSSYGDIVRRLSIAINLEAPGPFLSAGIAIIRLTNRLKNLENMNIIYTAVRPPDVFFACLRRYDVLTVLSISGYAFKSTKHLDDYDPPCSSRFPLPLLNADIPKLTTIQFEVTQTEGGPHPSSTSTISHLIDWLCRSPVRQHLQKLWIVLGVAADTDDYETVRCINKLLTGCGESLQELVITIRMSPEVKEPERLISGLEGLTLQNNTRLRHLSLLRLPRQTPLLPALISESSLALAHLETVTLSFHPTDYSRFRHVDLALTAESRFPSLRGFVIDDANGTAVGRQQHALRSNLPMLDARGLVRLTEVDEDRL
ncbi:hypothetical protein EIP91_010250 [Steccherinum ochraceum]|uniref:Uncharacterized protein n=1 Tax=Steccherinum ochraceum TaxID=92696 RepID=A0A4R0R9Z6_9APHY|nr:hypothetical protein EIP91_010250 [Steccherinum ochraceum]